MNIKKIDKITHYELNVSRFELIIIADALDKLVDHYKNDDHTTDLKLIEKMLNEVKSNFP